MEPPSQATYASRWRWMRLRVLILLLILMSVGLAFVRPNIVRDGEDYFSDFLFPWQAAQHPAPLLWPTDLSEQFRIGLECACPLSLNAPCDCPQRRPYTAVSYPTAWFFVAYDLTMLAVMFSALHGMVRRYRRIQNQVGRIAFDLALLLIIVILGVVLFGVGVLLRDVLS